MSSHGEVKVDSLLSRTAKNVASGTAAGIAVCLVGHPFDTLKVRLQTQPVHRPVYTGLLDCFLKTLEWEGIGGLYKGVGSPIVGQMFFRATLFTSYYQITNVFAGDSRRHGERLTRPEYFLCGACTGVIASLAEGPIDLFKTKMQIQIIRAKSGSTVQYRHVFHAGYVIMKEHGIRGAYQGLTATWLRNIPSFACYFGFYELALEYFMHKTQKKSVAELPIYAQFSCGGIAGFLYWFFTYPTDVIKSTLQSDDSDIRKRRFTGIRDCVEKLYRDEGGWRRFYRGFLPCLLRSLPANAAMWFVLQKCRHIFQSK